MRKKVALNMQHLDISPEVKRNIKEIQRICNQDYKKSRFYGNAALRKKFYWMKELQAY